jgi:hypothetical protein
VVEASTKTRAPMDTAASGQRQLLVAYFGMTPQAMRPLPPPFSGLSE